ncbi:type VI secretion system Vgr family protein [Herbaspirillum sp. VT-16-41]|uniref:type VI secretion system Vgr family protein n=1 Tax=Herbaspirillum sp. VT-16-41 TaxID=1953765 RepID=UPI000981EF84|nr:type VI secretion system Vgr family protein [Herbaspirillum sp. VT-16-41]ONN67622.1 type IV secretion protein Rhs [Herbaspirillum sp. VT-16-41]
MNHAYLLKGFPASLLSEAHRGFRLLWEQGLARNKYSDVLLLQSMDVSETLCGGVLGHLTCLSPQVGLPLKDLIGTPLSVQIVTAEQGLHSISGIITDARAGQSDGALAVYQLTVRDALSILDGRINHRVFRRKSVPAVIDILLREWRHRSPTLGRAFDFDTNLLNKRAYPEREFIHQFHESDAHFIRRLCKREGIGWFIAHGPRLAPHELEAKDGRLMGGEHRLVLFDTPLDLPRGVAEEVRFHRAGATETSDSIQVWSSMQTLRPGSVARSSWDYKRAGVHQVQIPGLLDQGIFGNDLARLLCDAQVDVPHVGDSERDHKRLATARMLAHERQALRVEGISTVRNLEVGHWFSLRGHPELARTSDEDRQFIVTSLRHRGRSNLPKDMEVQVQALLRQEPDAPPDTLAPEQRYWNSFTCLHRGQSLTPDYDPHLDLPRTYPITALVVGPPGEEIFTDELGRIKVQLQGLDPEDHVHTGGAGTSARERDSAYVRVSSSLAGPQFGASMLPRVGMEVVLDFMHGDPDKMFVSGVLPNALNRPASFSNTGALPGNRFLSGIKTREFHGNRYNQLRFDDTPGQTSSQLASEHAGSQLNLGFLTHPRSAGHGTPRGEGVELRTDAAASVRAARGILMSSFARKDAAGELLDRAELTQLLEECSELLQALGTYAGQHGGQAPDTAPQAGLRGAMQHWDSTKAQSDQAILAFGAAAGAVHLTPKTQVSYAGQNVDTVAQQHLQLTSGQRTQLTAGRGVFVFSRQDGISAVAHHGDIRLQARSDRLQANAQKEVLISANEGEVRITGKSITLVAEDGSYLKLGGGIKLGTQGDLNLHAADHHWGGPDGAKTTPGMSSSLPTDQQFLLRYPQAGDQPGALASGQQYRIRTEDGRTIETQSDLQGLSQQVDDEAMRLLAIDVLKPRI